MSDNLWSFISAWLLFVVLNRDSLHAILKKREQRTKIEKAAIERGLIRAMCFELCVTVPASTGLVLLLRPFLYLYSKALADMAKGQAEDRVAFYTLLGLLSYGFPFTILRERVGQALKVMFGSHASPMEASHDVPAVEDINSGSLQTAEARNGDAK